MLPEGSRATLGALMGVGPGQSTIKGPRVYNPATGAPGWLGRYCILTATSRASCGSAFSANPVEIRAT
jgi:hypothetical protein